MCRRSLLGLLIVLTGCAGMNPKPEGPEVDSLKIEGTRQLKPNAVKAKILTGASSWVPAWVPLLGHEDYFDPSAWQADLRRIERFYQSQGYYQAKVLDDDVVDTKPGHV